MRIEREMRYKLEMNQAEVEVFMYICNPETYEYAYRNYDEDEWLIIITGEERYEDMMEEIERFINKIDNDFEENERIIDSDEWEIYRVAKEIIETEE